MGTRYRVTCAVRRVIVLLPALLLLGVAVSAASADSAKSSGDASQFSWSPSLVAFTAIPGGARAAAARPAITRLSASAAKPGARLTISGRGFGGKRGKSTVLFGVFKATKYLRWSRTRIVCEAPAMPAGRVLVKVRTARGSSRGKAFTVRGLPTGALAKLWLPVLSTESCEGAFCPWPDMLYYYRDGSDLLAVVTLDEPEDGDNRLVIDTLDLATLRRVGGSRTVSLAGWPQWGGFYAGPDDCFYVLVGQSNLGEDDDRDVVAVRRYDSDWNLLGTAYLKGSAGQVFKGIYEPFAFSAPDMVLMGDRLVVHMARTMYLLSDGLHHQANLTFEVDTATMTAMTFDQLDRDNPYCSHSFRQLVTMNGTSLVTIDHGDGYPRGIQMGVMADYPSRQMPEFDLFLFNGAIGENFTGAAVTGVVSGPSGIVVVGNSIAQPDAPDGPLGFDGENRNAFTIWANPATGQHTVRWLTDYAPDGSSQAFEPRAVDVAPDRYAVLFSVAAGRGYRMEYRLIDSSGTLLASASFPDAFFYAISDPILMGDRLYWIGGEPYAGSSSAYLFGLDLSNPAAPSLLGSAL